MFKVIDYWEQRFRNGGDAGAGSRGHYGNTKAAAVNKIIAEHDVQTVIDWGCGDGLMAARIIASRYIGLDVSPAALELCRHAADGPGREWHLYDGFTDPGIRGDLALSLEVIFHLVDDALYHRYMELLFGSAPLVCVVSSNRDERGEPHVLHRLFVRDVPADFKLLSHERNVWVFRRES